MDTIQYSNRLDVSRCILDLQGLESLKRACGKLTALSVAWKRLLALLFFR